MASWPRVVVAGGSIGGLTAAVLLHDLGCDVDVYERSSAALQSRGAGIVVLPITERYFTERGGDDDRVSLELTYWTYVDSTGKVLSADPDHFRFSGWNTVYRALLDVFPAERYHLDSEMVDVEPGADAAAIVLTDGRRITGDLVVCADGVASTARRILLPGVEPVYAGYVAWRGTTLERRLSSVAQQTFADSMVYQVLDRSHVLVYAMPAFDGSVEPGSRVMNFVWYRNYPEGAAFDSIMTDRAGEHRPATVPPGMVAEAHLAEMRRYASHHLAPAIAEVVLGSEDTFIQAIYDLESPQMVFGRACIMGDAAFALRPHVAAGQAKACADAWALRDALAAAAGDVDGALAAWEPRQLELGRTVVERSRRMGIRSQFEGAMVPGDPTWKFGLFAPGN